MDVPILLVYAVVFLAIKAATAIDDRRRAMVDPWTEAARAAELSEVQLSYGLTGARLRGRKGPFAVELTRNRAYKEKTMTSVVIGGLPPSLTLKLERAASVVRDRARGTRDLETGDREFDEEVYLHGSPAWVHAMMDPATRARVRSMLRNAVIVHNGTLQAIVEEEYALGPGTPIESVLPELVGFAELLARPADIVPRLVANAKSDPEPRVRLTNLLTLVREFPGHEATRPALEAALTDHDDEVRLRAAMLVPEGGAVLLDIAAGQHTDDSCAGRAITALGRQLAAERVPAILAQALRTRRVHTASACLAWLGRFRPPGAAATLAKVLAREKGPLAGASAQALATCGQPEAEPALIAALEHDSRPARLAAAEALEAGGSAAAVESLRRAEADRTAEGDFRRAARQAIAAIQARAGSAKPGQLTLAEGESGRLSLEDEQAGHVSLAPATGHDSTAGRR